MIKLSHSSVTTYKECPQKYNLKYKQHIKPFIPMRWPLVVGVAFHNLANKMYNCGDFSFEYLRRGWKECFTDAMDTEASAFADTTGSEEYLKQGYILVAQFYKFAKENGYLVKPMASEWVFELVYEDFKIKGIVDLIFKMPDGSVHILDFKTGWAMPSDDAIAVHPQLTLYHWGVLKGMGIDAAKVGLFFPRKAQIKLSTRSESDHVQLLTEYSDIAKRLSKQDYTPNLSHCAHCEFAGHCPHYVKPVNATPGTTGTKA